MAPEPVRSSFIRKGMSAALALRFPSLTAMVRRRLSREEKFGLHVTAGIVLTLCFMWLFFRVAEDIVGRDALLRWDLGVLDSFRAHRTPFRDKIMLFITTLGNWQVVAWGMIFAALFLSVRKQWHRITALLVSVIGGGAFVMLMKAVVQRPRPPLVLSLTQVQSTSFPSGHSFVAFSFYGLLTYFLFRSLRGTGLKALALILGTVVVIVIGASRVYLGVHWPSDVLASYASGAAWLTVLVTALETYPDPRRSSTMNARRAALLCLMLLFAWLAFAVLSTRSQQFAPDQTGKTHHERVQCGGYERPVTFVSTAYMQSRQVA